MTSAELNDALNAVIKRAAACYQACRNRQPLLHLSRPDGVAGQPLVSCVFLREINQNRIRIRERDLAVLNHRYLTKGIHTQKRRGFLGMFISYQIAPYLKQKRLKIVLEKFEPPPRPINIVYPHARLLPTRTRMFIEWIKQELHPLKL